MPPSRDGPHRGGATVLLRSCVPPRPPGGRSRQRWEGRGVGGGCAGILFNLRPFLQQIFLCRRTPRFLNGRAAVFARACASVSGPARVEFEKPLFPFVVHGGPCLPDALVSVTCPDGRGQPAACPLREPRSHTLTRSLQHSPFAVGNFQAASANSPLTACCHTCA